MTLTRLTVLAALVVAQLLLVGVAVAGQLSARVTGEEYLLEVGPVDPIVPFRGAYVDLSYPDLQPPRERSDRVENPTHDQLFVVLRRQGEVWVAADHLRKRPTEGPYLTCEDDWQLRCGIESVFLPQERAAAIQRGGGPTGSAPWVARIKVDRWGNAALVDFVVSDSVTGAGSVG
jgi:uncharacterized membrane-anchored protein